MVLSSAIISMVLTPFVSGLTGPLYSLRKRWFKHEPLQTLLLPDSGLANHVLIAGGGRVGQYVAQVLKQLEHPFAIIELDSRRVDQAKEAGFPVIYGDAGRAAVLEAAGIDKACLLLVTTPAIVVAQSTVFHARQLNPSVDIVARVEGVEDMKALFEKGVTEVVKPNLEAGLEIAGQALFHLHVPPTQILHYTDQMRRNLHAQMCDDQCDYQMVSLAKSAESLLELTWHAIDQNSPLYDQTIRELAIRTQTGVSVVGVIRDGTFHANPDAAFRFAAGDIVSVVGMPEQIIVFQKMARQNE